MNATHREHFAGEPPHCNELHAPENIQAKPSLWAWYQEMYRNAASSLANAPKEGLAIELGSGSGLIKTIIPEIITTEITPNNRVDQAVDATQMPFADESVRFIFLLNVLHHIPDVEAFFKEANRCLMPGGRIFIVDQYRGWFSRFIYKYAHNEPYDDKTPEWRFVANDPMKSANGALAWIVFDRDQHRFASLFPKLRVQTYRPHTPLRYWLTGGLKHWTLLPRSLFGLASWIDRALVKLNPKTASFIDIEIVKQ